MPQNSLHPLLFDRLHSRCRAHSQTCTDRHCVPRYRQRQTVPPPGVHRSQYRKHHMRPQAPAKGLPDTFLSASQHALSACPIPSPNFPLPVIAPQDNIRSPDQRRRSIYLPCCYSPISIKKFCICLYAFSRNSCLHSSVNTPHKRKRCIRRKTGA